MPRSMVLGTSNLNFNLVFKKGSQKVPFHARTVNHNIAIFLFLSVGCFPPGRLVALRAANYTTDNTITQINPPTSYKAWNMLVYKYE